jgi:hypothetical protein
VAAIPAAMCLSGTPTTVCGGPSGERLRKRRPAGYKVRGTWRQLAVSCGDSSTGALNCQLSPTGRELPKRMTSGRMLGQAKRSFCPSPVTAATWPPQPTCKPVTSAPHDLVGRILVVDGLLPQDAV